VPVPVSFISQFTENRTPSRWLPSCNTDSGENKVKFDLNTSIATDFPRIAKINTSPSGTDPSWGTAGSIISATRMKDTVAVAVAPRALAVFAADRASKLEQLTVAVRNGSYSVSSASISRSILASAMA
jgi:hypothetical protein